MIVKYLKLSGQNLSMRICEIETNLLQNNAYQLVLSRFPKTEFFSTDFQMPELALPVAQVATPFTDLPFAGDKPIFGPMRFNFLVNEDMSNFYEVYNWIHSIGFAESYENYNTYQNKTPRHQSLGEQDAKVIVLSSKGNPVRAITFFDAIPTSLSGMEFTSQDPETQYVKASVTMAYSRYEFTNL